MNFINKEIERINEKLSKNENKNVLFESKHTKFGINKFLNNNEKINPLYKKDIESLTEINIKYDISQIWLVQKANNCCYNAYIIFFYFRISPSLSSLKDTKLVNLNKLNDLVLKLSENVTEKNY